MKGDARTGAAGCRPTGVPGVVLLALALIAPLPLGAVTVHSWTDADGVRHFSDRPPPDASAAEVFDIDAAPPADVAGDYYSIANQWARLRAEREAADTRALERRRLQAEADAAAQPPPPPFYDDAGRAVILPWGPAYPWGHPRRHGHRRPFPIDREAYLGSRRGADFLPAQPPAWPRER